MSTEAVRDTRMFILTTREGNAYHRTNGLPSVYERLVDLEADAIGQPGGGLSDWAALEVSETEADFLTAQAHMAIYGRRDT